MNIKKKTKDNKNNKKIKKIKKIEIRRKISKISDGLMSTMADFFLFHVHVLNSIDGNGTKAAYRAISKAHSELEEINSRTIRNTIGYLKRRGLIRILKEPEITYMGKEKLQNTLPVYQHKRPWDKSIYLITYDIPERKRIVRDKLRDFLERLGAGMLQASVWLTPYNPSKNLKQFHEDNNDIGEIIISCIGKDGYIGKKSIQELLQEVYCLDELNYRYEAFIEQFKNQSQAVKYQAAISYLSILSEDPQLPWELLPKNWLGDKAYLLYKKITLQNEN